MSLRLLLRTLFFTVFFGHLWGCNSSEDYFPKDYLARDFPAIPSASIPFTEDKTICEDADASRDIICDPLGGGPTPDGDIPTVPRSALGLLATLYEGQPEWNDLRRYELDGYKHPESIYFSNFNIPVRSFSEGFSIGQNDYLKNSLGQKLIEWFAIKVEGNITIPENEEDGWFHITAISDDGIILKIEDDVLISNPRTHAPLFECSSKLVYLEKYRTKRFRLDYFQGPRHHIALSLFIKRVENVDSFQNPSGCNSNQSNVSVLDRGYRVIGPAFFTLPR